MFKICSHRNDFGKGFHMTFANGNTISVQFGGGNYCENKDLEDNKPNLTSKDAEIMVWDSNKNPIAIDGWTGDDGIGAYLSSDDVAKLIGIIANL
jgi:hypothetical protein